MKNSQNGFVILITFVVAFILTLLPMPTWTVWLRPAWVLMVVIYWIMVLPQQVNMGVAWMAGLFLDVLNGTLLGEHALAFTVPAYIVAKTYSQIKMSPLLQQGLTVFLLVVLYQFILFCIQGFIGSLPNSHMYWLASLTSMLMWPWVFSLIRNFQRRFRVV